MSWRKEVTFDDLLSANDTQYDTIVKLEQEIENLKRDYGYLNKDYKRALESFIGVPINFTYGEHDEREDFEFIGTDVRDDSEGIILWNDDHCYVTLDYAIKNVIKEGEVDWKEEYTHASQSIDYWKRKYENMREDFERVDDAATYWRDTFRDVFEDAVSGTDKDVISVKYLNDYQQ